MGWNQELFFSGQADRWSEKKPLSLPAAQFHLLGLFFPPNGTGRRGNCYQRGRVTDGI